MTTVRAWVIVPVLLLAIWHGADASGVSPTCKFSNGRNGSIIEGARYKLGQAYAASDLVAIGSVSGQRVEIQQLIKGGQGLHDLDLQRRSCAGTACTGMSLPPKFTFLLLLVKTADGAYMKVDGNGNDACPNVFEVVSGKVQFGHQSVPVADLAQFLSNPATLVDFP